MDYEIVCYQYGKEISKSRKGTEAGINGTCRILRQQAELYGLELNFQVRPIMPLASVHATKANKAMELIGEITAYIRSHEPQSVNAIAEYYRIAHGQIAELVRIAERIDADISK